MTRAADIRQWTVALLELTRYEVTADDGTVSVRYDIDRAVTLAEACDERLAERGYPASDRRAKGEAKPRAGSDHYGALSDQQRSYFDRLYRAYSLTKGKQEAAQAWARLSPAPELAERIIAAAAADALGAIERGAKYASGTQRKNLQGWLSARRWEDAPASAASAPVDPVAERRRRVAELLGERKSLVEMHRQTDNPDLLRQVERVDDALKQLGLAIDSRADAASRRAERARSGPSPLSALLGRLPTPATEPDA